MTSEECAYIAGLLDGDGSIVLQLKKRKGMRFLFRIKTVIVFYQDLKYYSEFVDLQKILGTGYVYKRNDHMCEIRIEGFNSVESLLEKLKPYVRLKCQQVTLMLQAIHKAKKKKYSVQEFLSICRLADKISELNYSSKQRIYTYKKVKSILEKQDLIPVTTGSST